MKELIGKDYGIKETSNLELLTVEQLASCLGIHQNTVYRHVSDGTIPCIRILGRQIRFREKDIHEWLKQRSNSPAPLPEPHRVEISTEIYDKIYLKKGGNKALSKSSRRWRYGIGTIYLRQSKKGLDKWCIDYKGREGKRVREVVKDAQSRGEALVVLQEKIASNFDKNHGITRKRDFQTLDEVFELFLENYAKPNKKSWRVDEYRFRVISRFLGKMKMNELAPSEIQRYRQSRLDQRIAKHTTNRELALLKKLFSWANEEGLVDGNPVKKVKMFSETDTARTRTLSPEEEERLLNEISSRLYPVVLTALHAGLRRGEILGLKWKDIDFQHDVLKVEHTKSQKVRFIPINSALREEFLRLFESRRNPTNVFPYKSIQAGFENACRRAKLEDFTFHDLRRTFGTRLLERGVNIITISKLYGHSSVLVTQRYLHPQDALSREAVELLVPPKNLAQICHTAEKALSELPVSHSNSVS